MRRVIKGAAIRLFDRLGFDVQRHQASALDAQHRLLGDGVNVIFDVGAHTGETSAAYHPVFSSAAIYAFEPFEPSFRLLELRARRLSCITPHNLALSDAVGEVLLNANEAPETNSILPADARGAAYWGDGMRNVQRVRVRTMTVDAFCSANHISHIDILKLDVQGAETRVLTGALAMLRRHAISTVFMEILVVPAYAGQGTMANHMTMFEALGYRLVDIYNARHRGIQLTHFDALFALAHLTDRSTLS